MTDIQIEKNIEMPSRYNKAPKKKGREVKWSWPLAKMEVGDSIYVPITEFSQSVQEGKDHITHHCNNAIRMQVIRKTVDKKFKFASRQVLEGKKVVGARVWRTA
jgi:hypothetical protein